MNRAAALFATAGMMGLVWSTAPAQASETTTFSYDALGRLVRSENVGGPNNGWQAQTCLDAAGNRTRYAVGTGTPPGCTGGPPSGNQAPVAVNDTGSTTRCAAKLFNVLANDYDPDGNTPLALVSLSYNGLRGTAEISGSSIDFTPNDITGTAVVTYTMRDSLGATDSATLTITIGTGTNCGPYQ